MEACIETDENRLKITITDDGCGMDEATLKKLRELIKNPKETGGIGLSNIIQRLRLFYGDDYSFEIESTVNKGTTIFVSVPDHIRES